MEPFDHPDFIAALKAAWPECVKDGKPNITVEQHAITTRDVSVQAGLPANFISS